MASRSSNGSNKGKLAADSVVDSVDEDQESDEGEKTAAEEEASNLTDGGAPKRQRGPNSATSCASPQFEKPLRPRQQQVWRTGSRYMRLLAGA